jgi:CRISPR-associated endonuclease/helicase Cas3
MRPTFQEFFAELNNEQQPFPWQVAVAEDIRRGNAPDWITQPTGLGKSAVIDAWVYALAASIDELGTARVVPTRLIFVVNRRGIVDDAHRRAERIAQQLVESLEASNEPASQVRNPASLWVAQQLKSAGYLLSEPLQVVRMRGGLTWDWRWLRQPDQPAVVSATVDQFGSRLLFRGYGVGERFKSLDAALVGVDSLIVLDEAHLSEPLVETVNAVRKYQHQPSEFPISRTLSACIRMTATPPASVSTDERLVGFGPADAADPIAGLRINSEKHLRLIEVESEKKSANDAVAEVAVKTVEAMLARLPQGQDSDSTALIIMNTVAMARQVFSQLKTDEVDCALIIGSSRSFERERADSLWRYRMHAGRTRQQHERPFVLVATQTVEVGADIDADALVTEACSFDALVQRLGRLDRLGLFTEKLGKVDAALLWNAHRHDPAAPSGAIYQHASNGTFLALQERAGAALKVSSRSPVELDQAPMFRAGPAALSEFATDLQWSSVLRTPTYAPVMLPGAVTGWAQTAPLPVPDRPVEPYLHGPGRGNPEVTICWRDISSPGWPDVLSALSPVSGETVTVGLGVAYRFLVGVDAKSLVPENSDTLDEVDDEPVGNRSSIRSCALYRNETWTPFPVGTESTKFRIRPGDTIVVDSKSGGHDQWGWTPDSDVAVVDICDLVERRKPMLLLSSAHLQQLGAPPIVVAECGALHASFDTDDEDEARKRFLVAIQTCAELETNDFFKKWSNTFLELYENSVVVGIDLKPEKKVGAETSSLPTEPPQQILMLVPVTKTGFKRRFVDPAQLVGSDDTDVASSTTARQPVKLNAHLQDVGTYARGIAVALGLDDELVDAVELAARLHDIGKADRRFQTLLRNADWVTAELEDGTDNMLAKSGAGPRHSRYEVPAELRWPIGLRHEAVSTYLLHDTQQWREGLSEKQVELVLQLTGAHHGHFRPLFPPVVDVDQSDVSVAANGLLFSTNGRSTQIDWARPQSFNDLNERYSAWGLAFLESIVRFADLWISEEGR